MKNEVKHIIESCESELIFKTSRSSGSGGQHVNKVETKVTLRWDVENSENLTSEQKEKILKHFSSNATKEGEIVIHNEKSRSQSKNKQNVISKWKLLIQESFIERKKRKAIRISKAAKEKRRKAKEYRSKVKAARKKPTIDKD